MSARRGGPDSMGSSCWRRCPVSHCISRWDFRSSSTSWLPSGVWMYRSRGWRGGSRGSRTAHEPGLRLQWSELWFQVCKLYLQPSMVLTDQVSSPPCCWMFSAENSVIALVKCDDRRNSQREDEKPAGHCVGFLSDKVAAQVISGCFQSQFDDFLEC